MGRLPMLELVLVVVGIAGGFYLSSKLASDRVEEKITTKERSEMTYFPFFGIDKFWADVKWMECINQMGQSQSPKKEGVVNYIHDEFATIIDLDPDFSKVYTEGLPFISYEDLDRTLALLDKGEKYAAKEDWNRGKMGAYWLLSHARNLDSQARSETATPDVKEKAQAQAKEYMTKAQGYLKDSLDAQGDWSVVSMLLHTEARKEGKYGSPYEVDELQIWNKYLMDELKERQSAAPEGSGEEGQMAMGEGDGSIDSLLMGESGSGSGGALERVRERIIDRARKVMQDLIVEEGVVSGAKKDEVLKKQNIVRDIYTNLDRSGKFAPRSLAPYEAGELFDSTTGDAVVPYGIDLYDYEVNDRITPIRGAYNQYTGKPVATDFVALETALSKEGKKITRLKAQADAAAKYKAN